MGKVARFQDSLYDKPLLALPKTVESVFSYLNSRNSGEFELSASKSSFNATTSEVEFDSASKIGTLRIDGPLSYRSTILSALCNLTSYQKLEADFLNLISLGAKKVVLLIDSGGGESYGCFETAALIRSLADKSDVRLIAYADGIAASAAYAFASVAHEFVMNPHAEAGSVGVVVRLRNANEAMTKMGVKDTYVYAGDSKIPFDASGDWSEEFIADLQSKVDVLYGDFTKFVSKYRKISVKDVIATNAKMFSAKDAIKLGLADKAMTREELGDYLKIVAAPVKPVTATKPKVATKPIAAKAEVAPLTAAQKWVGIITPSTNDAKRKPTLTPQQRLSRIQRNFAQPYEIETIYKQTRSLNDSDFENKLKKLEQDLGLIKRHG